MHQRLETETRGANQGIKGAEAGEEREEAKVLNGDRKEEMETEFDRVQARRKGWAALLLMH
jgi:hypothetical protein